MVDKVGDQDEIRNQLEQDCSEIKLNYDDLLIKFEANISKLSSYSNQILYILKVTNQI